MATSSWANSEVYQRDFGGTSLRGVGLCESVIVNDVLRSRVVTVCCA